MAAHARSNIKLGHQLIKIMNILPLKTREINPDKNTIFLLSMPQSNERLSDKVELASQRFPPDVPHDSHTTALTLGASGSLPIVDSHPTRKCFGCSTKWKRWDHLSYLNKLKLSTKASTVFIMCKEDSPMNFVLRWWHFDQSVMVHFQDLILIYAQSLRKSQCTESSSWPEPTLSFMPDCRWFQVVLEWLAGVFLSAQDQIFGKFFTDQGRTSSILAGMFPSSCRTGDPVDKNRELLPHFLLVAGVERFFPRIIQMWLCLPPPNHCPTFTLSLLNEAPSSYALRPDITWKSYA